MIWPTSRDTRLKYLLFGGKRNVYAGARPKINANQKARTEGGGRQKVYGGTTNTNQKSRAEGQNDVATRPKTNNVF